MRALRATGVFVLTCAALVPFSAGHQLYRYWETAGKFLLITTMLELLWIVYRWVAVYGSYIASRDIKREYHS